MCFHYWCQFILVCLSQLETYLKLLDRYSNPDQLGCFHIWLVCRSFKTWSVFPQISVCLSICEHSNCNQIRDKILSKKEVDQPQDFDMWFIMISKAKPLINQFIDHEICSGIKLIMDLHKLCLYLFKSFGNHGNM